MRNLLLLLSVIVAILLSACEKDDPKEQIDQTPNPVAPTNFFISGTYYDEYGDSIGIANAEIVLETEDDFGVPVIVGLDTTDENGCFWIDYEKLNRNELTLFVRWIDPNSITNPLNGFRYQCLPGDTTFDALRLFDGMHQLMIRLEVTYSQASVGDTLFLPQIVSPQLDSIEIDYGIKKTWHYYAVLSNNLVFKQEFITSMNSNMCSTFNFKGRGFLGRQALMTFGSSTPPNGNEFFEIGFKPSYPLSELSLNYQLK